MKMPAIGLMTRETPGWALVDRVTEKLMLYDGHTPIYWLRRVAQAEANKHGFTTVGTCSDVRICRVVIRPIDTHMKAIRETTR